MRRWLTIAMALALAVPPTAVLVGFAASGAVALTTGQPLVWPAQTVTLTEAIGMHDTAEVVRQIALGANPRLMGRMTGADPDSVRATARTARSPAELPPARELLAGIAALFSLPGATHGYDEARTLDGAVDLPR